MNRSGNLFCGEHGGLPRVRAVIREEVGKMEGNRLLSTDVEELVKYFVDRFSFEIPVLHEAEASPSQYETPIDVSRDPLRRSFGVTNVVTGTAVDIEVPFTGDANAFSIRPNPSTLNPPFGRVDNGSVIFTIKGTGLTSELISREYQSWLADVRQNLTRLTENFKDFSKHVGEIARDTINERRQKLLNDQNLIAGLGLPLKPRPEAAQTYTLPTVRRKITPTLPASSSAQYKPEHVISEEIYQHILDVIQDMVVVMEKSPTVFHKADEESLRTMILVPLNGHYDSATGETFNYKGKTDILIQHEGRSVFIAECKFWGGPAQLTATIDQLLGYLAWRDSKAAILIFNRNKDFTKVLESIDGVVETHPNFVRNEGKKGDSRFRYKFRHKDDPAKMLHVTVMAFDIPRPEKANP